MTEYNTLFEDIDRVLGARFGKISLPFRIIGRSALEMAGLPERGTKDVDVLGEFLRVDTLSDEQLADIEKFLNEEFGKNSPGAIRHGLYLDLVAKSIAWLPPRPRFIDEKNYTTITLSRLHPVDVCVSKTFSNFKQGAKRGRDRTDIIEAIDTELIDVAEYVKRMGESLNSSHNMQSGVEEIFPKIIRFIENDIITNYGDSSIKLKYTLPPWMENA